RPVEGLADRVGDDGLGTAILDLDHRVPAEPLLPHPGERLAVRPVAAEPDLYEVPAGDPTLLDQPSHRLAVGVEVPPLVGARVGVRIEMDDPDGAGPRVMRHRGRARIRDRM